MPCAVCWDGPNISGWARWKTHAEHVIAQDEEARRISERVRIVPDGYGRLSPDIDPQVLTAAMEAVTRNRQLRFSYMSSQGHKLVRRNLPSYASKLVAHAV